MRTKVKVGDKVKIRPSTLVNPFSTTSEISSLANQKGIVTFKSDDHSKFDYIVQLFMSNGKMGARKFSFMEYELEKIND